MSSFMSGGNVIILHSHIRDDDVDHAELKFFSVVALLGGLSLTVARLGINSLGRWRLASGMCSADVGI